MNLKDKKLFLFDMDGTIAIGDKLIDGSKEFIEHIKNTNGRSMYITNNATKSVEDYILKFRKWGIETSKDDFITSSYVTIKYIQNNYKDIKVFVLGTNSLISEMKKSGIDVTEKVEEDIKLVVVSYDTELNYNKIINVCKILQTMNVDYIATNIDYTCPIDFGFVPDCGAICTMIEFATNRTPKFIGKPEPEIVLVCMENSGFGEEETLVVGDRLYTDIACGINANVDTALVFTGEAKKEDVFNSDIKPTYVFENISDLSKCFK